MLVETIKCKAIQAILSFQRRNFSVSQIVFIFTEKSMYFGGKSQLTLRPTVKPSYKRRNFSFEIQFKPERSGIIMFANHSYETIVLALLKNGKVVLL